MMSSKAPLGPRSLTFPSKHTMGTIFVRDWGHPGYAGWLELGPAASRIEIHPQKEVMLRLSWSGSQHLSELEHLAPDALQWLDCRDTQISDTSIRSIERLTGLHALGLGHTGIGDAGLETIGKLQSLQELYMAGTAITGVGLKAIRELHNLQQLALNDTATCDVGLQHIGQISSLVRLWLRNINATNTGLEHLHPLKSLKRIDLGNHSFSDDSIKKLRRAIPRCYLASNA